MSETTKKEQTKIDFIDRVWNKATIIEGKNPNLYRADKYGNQMFKPSYGKTSAQGWELDHSKPKSKGGTNHLNNINATQWKQNRQKSNKYPYSGN